MKILVAIANFGTQNTRYLSQLLDEYRLMPHDVHVVVLSNVPKNLGPDVEVQVGLPTSDPWSLPFAHKRIFEERLEQYDAFIYSEDDTLVTTRNVEAYLEVSSVLPEDEVPGFLRFEKRSDGSISYCDVHECFHWDPASVRSRGSFTFAFFTNEHAACYMLTQAQLRRAIGSGQFLVGPYRKKYDLLCTAATDPYTICGLRKMICISHLSDFLLHHLPNKYVDSVGIQESELRRQIDALLEIGKGQRPVSKIMETETSLPSSKWSKSYYEPCNPEVVRLFGSEIKSVLSVGCGSGCTEEWLTNRGVRVTAIPLDSVISSCARARGLEVVDTSLNTADRELHAEFDCVLISNLLHLAPDPSNFLSRFVNLLSPKGKMIISVPNLSNLPVILGRIRFEERFRTLSDYGKSGVHVTSPRIIERWLSAAGLEVIRRTDVVSPRNRKLVHLTFGLASHLLASEMVVVAGKRSSPTTWDSEASRNREVARVSTV